MRVESNHIVLFNAGSRKVCFEPTLDHGNLLQLSVKLPPGMNEEEFVFDRDEIELFQLALLNFLNTGHFDQEG